MRGENWRFWLPVALLAAMSAHIGQKLVRAHVAPVVSAPNYGFERQVLARRGSIYSANGREYPFVKSVPHWEYSLDPVDLEKSASKTRSGRRSRTKEAILKTIADALGLEYGRVLEMAKKTSGRGFRSQFLALSSDPDVYRTLPWPLAPQFPYFPSP